MNQDVINRNNTSKCFIIQVLYLLSEANISKIKYSIKPYATKPSKSTNLRSNLSEDLKHYKRLYLIHISLTTLKTMVYK